MDLKEKVKGLPSCPGVYLMKDSLESIIYVGKSKNLKSRVGSYFQDSKSHPPKVIKMVRNIADFEHIVTDTEFEAFLLENKLIKEYKPLYNKLMKNTKAYSFIRISLDEKQSAIEITDEAVNGDGNLYFGPYTSKNTVERGLQGIKECCRILCTSGCKIASPCLNYSLGLCIGMCTDSSARYRYLEILAEIAELLRGSDRSIIEAMEQSMENASQKLDFEGAAKYRDYISAVNYLVGRVKVLEYARENRNIVLLESLDDGSIKYFLIKGSSVLFSEKHSRPDSEIEKLKNILKFSISAYFGNEASESSSEITRDEVDQAQIIYSYIKNRSNNCRHVVIKPKWLNASNSTKLDGALDRLFPAKNLD